MPGVIVPQMREKKDPLEALARGLQIATQVYGLKQASDKADADEADRLEKQGEKMAQVKTRQEQERGVLTPMQRAAMAKDFEEVASGTPGAIPAFVRDAQTGKETPLFLKVRGKEVKPDKKTTLTSADTMRGGKKGKLTKYSDGSEDFIEAPPDAAPADKSPQNGQDLRKEYNSHPVTKRTQSIVAAYKNLEKAATKTDGTGATDIKMVYAFMKMQDPDSAVREGEYATAENTGGLDDKIINTYNKLLKGERLTPEQRQAFLVEAEDTLEGQLELQEQQDARYADVAKQFQVDPRYVIDPSFGSAKTSLAGNRSTRKKPQAAGEAFAKPGVAPPDVALDDIDAELRRRGALPDVADRPQDTGRRTGGR
jgi:hypothetical protein